MPPKGKTKKAADSAPSEPSLAESLSYLHNPRPFRNPAYSRSGAKRGRTVKQILTSDREREKYYREQMKLEAQNEMQVDGAQSSSQQAEAVFYSNIEAPPSILPQKKYCDITGLEGPYTHPTTGLRYHDKSIYEVVKSLNPAAQLAYLSARGVTTVVK